MINGAFVDGTKSVSASISWEKGSPRFGLMERFVATRRDNWPPALKRYGLQWPISGVLDDLGLQSSAIATVDDAPG